MKTFLDTNIIVDVFSKRQPQYRASTEIWSLVERGMIPGCISAISFNNIYYLLRRVEGRKKADRALQIMRDTFMAVPLDQQILNQAIDAGFKDFEDAIQYFSALHADSDYLITRNIKDFPKNGIIAILTPEAFLALNLDSN